MALNSFEKFESPDVFKQMGDQTCHMKFYEFTGTF